MTIARNSAMHISSLTCRVIVLLVMTLGPLPFTFGQNAATSQAAEPATTTQPTEVVERIASEVTADTIRARVAQIKSGTELSEVIRTEVIGLCEQALEQITLADNWAKQITEYEKGRQEAPTLLAQLKQRQEQAATQPAEELAVPAPPDAQVVTMPDAQLEELISRSDTELKKYQDVAKKLDDESKQLDDEAKTRLQRKTLIPELLSDAKKRIEKITADLSAPPVSGIAPQLAQARRTLLVSQKRAVEQEIKAYEEELRFYDARNDLLAARRDDAKRKADTAQALKTAQEAVVRSLRKTLLGRQRLQAEEELQTAPRAVRELAEVNVKLIAERESLDAEIDSLEAKSKIVKDLTTKLAKDFEFLQENIDQTETADLGPLMRKSREELDDLRSYEADLRYLQKKRAQARLRSKELGEEWLISVDIQADDFLESLRQSGEVPDVSRIEPKVRELLQSRRASLEQSRKLFNDYESRLRDLIAAEDALITKVDEFSEFVEEHIFWIPSTGPIHTLRFPGNWRPVISGCAALAYGILKDSLGHLPIYAITVLAIGALLFSRRKLCRDLNNISPRVARAHSDSYRLTLTTFVHTVLFSLPWAAALWFAAWRITLLPEAVDRNSYDLGQALAHGMRSTSLVILVMAFARNVCRPHGLAHAHFRWDASAVRSIHRNLLGLMIFFAPVTLVISATDRYPEPVWRDSFGRLVFVVGMLALVVFAQRILRPHGRLFASQLRKSRSRWIYNLRYFWYGIAVVMPIALAGASLVGYHYTAIGFTEKFAYTLLLILGLVFVHAMMVRWLWVAQRRLAIEQAKKRRAAAEEKAEEERPSVEPGDIEEKALDIGSIGEQTRTLLRSAMVLLLLIGLWTIWGHMLGALGFMQKVTLWSYTVEAKAQSAEGAATGFQPTVEYVTLANLVIAIIVIAATVILAKNIPGLLEITILQKLPLDMGGRYAFTTLVRYVIIVIGIIIAFSSIGVGWSKVQWLVAAMTVGLGFGLQEIFANFVSGLMLLFERPIRIGDTVTVGDVSGTVSRIRIRATTITGWDRKELVIPNKEFITGQIVNWTLSDSTLRLILPVGIAYGSDTRLAREVLYGIAKSHPNVLDDPAPKVLFTGFGDNSLNFEMRAYIATVDHYLSAMDELNNAIDQEFRKAGIEIAFPQRDIHLRSIQATLPVINPDAKKE